MPSILVGKYMYDALYPLIILILESALHRLKAKFEESRGSYVTQMEVYSQYIKSCADANQPRMLNLTDFTKLIKYALCVCVCVI